MRFYGVKKSPSPASPKIKVRVHRGLKNISISGTDLHRRIHPSADSKIFKGPRRIRFNCRGLIPAVRSASSKRPVLLASLKSGEGLLSLHRQARDENHQGQLHIVTSQSLDACDVIHETDMEDYLATLLPMEMNAAWPIEALKAQAVAARSYALYKKRSGHMNLKMGYETYYHLESSEFHQVSGHHGDRTEKTKAASLSTKGEILTPEDKSLVPIFFHAQCGGHTFTPEEVWQNSISGYRAVPCPYCRKRNSKMWRGEISPARLKKFLSRSGSKDRALRLTSHTPSAGKLKIYLGDQVFTFKKALLRRYFGREVFPSNTFALKWQRKKKGPTILLEGLGNGHGVGLCQLGALDLALQGWNYKKILGHYFPNFKLTRAY